MNILAVMLWQMNEHLPALQLMRAAAMGRTRVLGPNHPDAVISRQMFELMSTDLSSQTNEDL